MIEHELERKYPFLQHMREMSEDMYSRQCEDNPISAWMAIALDAVVVAIVLLLSGCATRPVVTQTQPSDTTQRPITQPESPWDFPRDPDAPHDPPVVVDRPQWRVDALRTQQSAISALLDDRVPVPADLVAVRDTLDYGLGYLDAGATWSYVATMQRRGIAGLQTSGVASSYADEFRAVLRALTMAAVREG